MKTTMTLLFAALAACFAGCSDYNLFPAADYVDYEGTFGSTDVDATVALPKDTAGKLMLVEIQTHQGALESSSDVAKSAPQAGDNPAPAGPIGEAFEGKVITPEMSKEFRGVRYMVVDFNQTNNPAVIQLTAELQKALSENDTERVKVITEALGEISASIINKVLTQGLN